MPDTIPPNVSWSLGRQFMLRVAGLPIDSVRPLRCPDSRRWAQRVLAEEERLSARGAELSDLLHGLVKAIEDDRSRHELIRLRRVVFNNRLPADPAGAVDLLLGLGQAAGDTAAQISEWLHDRRRLSELCAEGGPLLAGETARTRAALRALVGDERLRGGLLLASPTLDGQLDAFVADTSKAPGKRLRKIERSVLAYLYRTACKTSPFSTFTGVALGRFDTTGDTTGAGGDTDTAGDAAGRLAVRLPDAWSSHPRLNVVVLQRISDLIVTDPRRRGDLPVGLAPGWDLDEDRVRYVRRSVTAGDDDAAVTFDAVSDRLFFLRRSGVLERMMSLFTERPELRHRDLVDWLAEHENAEPAECERYLSALTQVGMVRVPCLDTDVHSPDPLRDFRDALRAVRRPWADRLADGCDGPVALLDRYPAAGVEERRSILRELRQRLYALQEELGESSPTLPQTLLYEDARAGTEEGPGVVMDADAWRGLLAGPLRSVERMLPAFDLTLPQRITFKGFFLARYGRGGRCEDLLRLVHDFHEDFFDQYLSFTARRESYDADRNYVPEENWLGLPQITAVDAARREFVARMRALWADQGPDAEEIGIDADLVSAVAGHLEPVAPDFAPQSHFLQVADRGPDGRPLAVLNRSYGGLSFPFSRFTHAYESDAEPLAERLRGSARERQPEGAVFAEITGGSVTSNLNLHGRMTDYQIVCPGEAGSVPEEDRLHLDDLYLEHDEATDRLVLRSHRLDREVLPVYLGYLVPMALPEMSRTLLLLSPTSMAPLDLWGGVPIGPERGGVTTRPRVRHGDLVLSRRSWTVAAADLPTAAPGTPDAERFLQWHRWRRSHGLPYRVFATVTEGGRGGAKPQYLDFDSWLSLAAFEGLLKSPQARVVLREALPDEDALHAASARGRHVAELAVETFTAVERQLPAVSQGPAVRSGKD